MASRLWLRGQIDRVHSACSLGSTNPATYWLRYATRALAWDRGQIASSLPSLQPKRTGWEWAYPSAAPLLKVTEVDSGLRPTFRMVRFFTSLSRNPAGVPHDWCSDCLCGR